MRLAVLGALVTAAAAVAVLFFAVVPHLRTSLENQRLAELQREASAWTPALESTMTKEVKAPDVDRVVHSLASRSDAEVTLLGIQRRQGAAPAFYILSTSRQRAPVSVTPKVQSLTGRVEGVIVDGKTAQVAVPVPAAHPYWVAVYARSLSGVHHTVDVFALRILLIGGIALLAMLLVPRLLKNVAKDPGNLVELRLSRD